MTWNSRNVRQSGAAPGGVLGVLFHIPGTMGFQNQEIGAEKRKWKTVLCRSFNIPAK